MTKYRYNLVIEEVDDSDVVVRSWSEYSSRYEHRFELEAELKNAASMFESCDWSPHYEVESGEDVE